MRMRRWAVLTGLVVASAAIGMVGAAPAGATIEGPCSGSGTFVDGLDSGGGSFTVDGKTGEVVEIPLEDTVRWQGAISGVSGQREVSGFVAVDLPWPWGKVNIESWGNDGKLASAVENRGEEEYDLPSLIPRGVEFKVYGEHNDQGVSCDFSVRVKVEGSAFDTPLTYGSVVLTLGSAGLLALAGRPRFKKIWVEHP